MTEYEAFCRAEAMRRGIDPEKAVIVANSEGGLTEPARVGKFNTGWSWWMYQLHYGGKGYEQYGTTAGMGNSFTALTGWAPGDPRAWRDACRYALDAVARGGWGPWYGAAARGITGFDGVDRTRNWQGTPAEEWDYRKGEPPVTVPFNPAAKIDAQPDDFSCSIQSAKWMLRALGRNPGDAWIYGQLLDSGIVRRDVGLTVSTGQQLADWITEQYGKEMGFTAQASPVTWDDVWAGAGTNPMICGGRTFGAGGHWVGIRGRNADGTLSIANSADGYTGVFQTISREQWDARGPWSCVWLDRGAAPVTPPAPAPSRAQTLLAEIEALVAELKTLVA